MNNILQNKSFTSTIVSIIIGYLLILLFFMPLYKGKVVHSSDITHGEGISHQIRQIEKKTGEKTYWNPYIFGGTPNYLLNEYYSDNVFKRKLYQWLEIGTKLPSNMVFLTFLFSFICFRIYKISPIISFIGSFAYAFCTFNMIAIEVGHHAKIRALTYLPLIIAGIQLIFNKKYLIGLTVSALSFTYLIFSNHIQITYYTLIIVGFLFLVEGIQLIKEKKIKQLLIALGLAIASLGIGVTANISKIYAGFEYKDYSIRGQQIIKNLNNKAKETKLTNGLDKEYAFRWSNGLWEPFTLMIPHFYGGGSSANYDTKKTKSIQGLVNSLQQQYPKASYGQLYPYAEQQYRSIMYWGDQPFTAGPYYAGAVICFLFVLGLLLSPTKRSWWLLGSFWFFLILSFGKNLPSINFFLFDFLPFYNKFRTVTMTMGIVSFILTLGAVLGLNDLVTKEFDTEKLKKKLYIAFGLTGGISLLFYIFSGVFSFMKTPQIADGKKITEIDQFGQQLFSLITDDRETLFSSSALLSFVYIALSAGLIWLFIRGTIKTQFVIIGIALLTVIDLWKVNKIYFGDDKFSDPVVTNNLFKLNPSDKKILADNKTHARTYDTKQNPTNDSKTSYYHYSIGGYHPAKLRRIQDVFDRHFTKGSQSVFNMLNIKYFKQGEKAEDVMVNPNACGNAWLVKEIKEVNNAEEEITAIGSLDAQNIAVINTADFKTKSKTYDNNGTISTTQYGPNDFIYQVDAKDNSFAVFSEIYYPKSWEVTIDGKPTKMLRVNYLLRGLEIPKGKHIVAFKFRPFSYLTGDTITSIASILVILLSLLAIAWEVYKNAKKNK